MKILITKVMWIDKKESICSNRFCECKQRIFSTFSKGAKSIQSPNIPKSNAREIRQRNALKLIYQYKPLSINVELNFVNLMAGVK